MRCSIIFASKILLRVENNIPTEMFLVVCVLIQCSNQNVTQPHIHKSQREHNSPKIIYTKLFLPSNTYLKAELLEMSLMFQAFSTDLQICY